MKSTISATALQGGLQFDAPLQLPDRCRVKVYVEPFDAAQSDWDTIFQSFQQHCREHPSDAGGQGITCEELHERR